ncbi:MAG: S8 family serine peptidase [Planctomycetota bacterium]
MRLIDLIVVSVIFFGIIGSSNECSSQQERFDRVKPGKPPVEPDYTNQLVVKFRDDIRARSQVGKFVSRSVETNRIVSELADLHHVQFEQLIHLDENKIANLEAKAFANSGRKQPDLSSMMIIQAPKEELQQIATKLHDSEFVEWVEFEMLIPEPPCFQDCQDIAPSTPNYQSFQSYRGPNPGLNMDSFWALGNSQGFGIKLADCEYWFNGDHEDLCDVTPEPGQTPNPTSISNGWHHHGTASLGVTIGGDNEFGIRGLAPEVDPYFFSEWTIEGGLRRASAIANAAAALDAGDVVLLEMQTSIGFGFGPAELNASVWTIVRSATDAGVIVVAAAGNGNQNLDSANYNGYSARGDSGAIIVGAGSASTGHNKLSFSTFGSRVDVQGWGQSVFTSGYGSFAVIGGDENQNYISGFNGTSSASAMLAGVCVALQSYAEFQLGRRLTPNEMRLILRETGWPQGSGGNIGRFPNMIEAGERILALGAIPGDVNCDGQVNLLDVEPFVDLISTGEYSAKADFDEDGVVGLLDVAPFVELLNGN